MKQITHLLSLLLFLTGCAKQSQELVEPEPPQEANLAIEVDRLDMDNIDGDSVMLEKEKTVIKPKTTVAEKTQPQPTLAETPSEVTSAVESKSTREIAEASGSKTSDKPVFIEERKPKFDFSHEVLFPDSSWDKYMIQRGDFLIKIAKNEYNDWTMWRTIYDWNKEIIGEDPNKIYPYNWLDLLKPSEQVDACKLTFFPRQTNDGESLWTIAKDVYGDEYAWIVLFWDNEELLESNDGIIYPGMELQIRERIDPCNSKS